jgi:hypothetical protein
MNIYSSPEKFGLRVVGEAEFSSGCYEFDTSVVWQDVETGDLYVADDSGCSCPIPFEDIGRGDLLRIDRLQTLLDYLDKRKADSYRYDPDSEWNQGEVAEIDAACIALIHKTREALA